MGAIEDAFAAIDASARHSAAYLVKTKARELMRRPMKLEKLHPGLSVAAPKRMIAVGEHKLEFLRTKNSFWFGAEVEAKAIIMIGRWLRRYEEGGNYEAKIIQLYR